MVRLSKAIKSSSISQDGEQHRPISYQTPNDAEIKNLIQQYVTANLSGDEEWTRASEIPSEHEIGGIKDGEVQYPENYVEISKMDEPYQSKEQYLKTQYNLMRQDGTMPLANCVADVRQGSLISESNDYRIYDEVFFTTIAVARDGLAFQLEFSGTSTGKIVRWAKSKRLRSGSLVALTPASDNFKTKCVPAIIASRLLENLEVRAPSKPSIFVYIGQPSQIEIDPQQKWIMLECTQGYWEAYRHTLKALQKVRLESFPMQQYLVDLKSDVDAPEYRSNNAMIDLSSIGHDDEAKSKLEAVNVLDRWPKFQEVGDLNRDPSSLLSQMDHSQIEALKRVLTKELAIVQGPPGTGKTFTSVCAIKILLENRSRADPPIIIAAQTNHAVDQILRHVSKFEPDFVRLGGQTTDYEVIKPKTLYEIKEADRKPPSAGTRKAGILRRAVVDELKKLLLPLQHEEPMSADMFFEHGLLTEQQRDSINQVESQWIADESTNKMTLWCDNRLSMVINQDDIDAYSSQLLEEHENLDEKELEAPDNDDDKFELLPGRRFGLFPGYETMGAPDWISDEDITLILAEHQNLQQVPQGHRPAIYNFLRRALTQKITEQVRLLGHRCRHVADVAKMGRWETDHNYLRTAKVIGLTTTGLSKYRGLLSLLSPKIVLIEEAAETLEPYTVAAIFDTLEHLILVGDHQQLRANCSYSPLVGEPYNFDVSLFERLVKNDIEYCRLNRQRRMRPEIRNLIKHIYPDLVDHSAVMDRPNIAGFDANNVWFWHHENEESVDEAKSRQNLTEAKMIVELTRYLVWNNIPLEKITILTFYNGQKKVVLDTFRGIQLFKGQRINVCTVDSYQGEENDIVLLSLVRNNTRDEIGFLDSINRACVALSRARSGFYMLGNARLILKSDHWAMVIKELQTQDAIRTYLPLYCPVHDMTVDARTYTDLEGLHGGCEVECQKQLTCGHSCPLKCHPGRECNHEDCEEQCSATLTCGHQCASVCGTPCECQTCSEATRPQNKAFEPVAWGNERPSVQRNTQDPNLVDITLRQHLKQGRVRDSDCRQEDHLLPPAEAAQQAKFWSELSKSKDRPSHTMKSTVDTMSMLPTQIPVQAPLLNLPIAPVGDHSGLNYTTSQIRGGSHRIGRDGKSMENQVPSGVQDHQTLVDLTESVALEETDAKGKHIRTSTCVYPQNSLI